MRVDGRRGNRAADFSIGTSFQMGRPPVGRNRKRRRRYLFDITIMTRYVQNTRGERTITTTRRMFFFNGTEKRPTIHTRAT